MKFFEQNAEWSRDIESEGSRCSSILSMPTKRTDVNNRIKFLWGRVRVTELSSVEHPSMIFVIVHEPYRTFRRNRVEITRK